MGFYLTVAAAYDFFGLLDDGALFEVLAGQIDTIPSIMLNSLFTLLILITINIDKSVIFLLWTYITVLNVLVLTD